jgi:hypothetical protein
MGTGSHRKASNEPKTSAGVSVPWADSLIQAHRTGPDSLTFFVKVVEVKQCDCPGLEKQNQELTKKKNTWQKVSGVLLLIITGYSVQLLAN